MDERKAADVAGTFVRDNLFKSIGNYTLLSMESSNQTNGYLFIYTVKRVSDSTVSYRVSIEIGSGYRVKSAVINNQTDMLKTI